MASVKLQDKKALDYWEIRLGKWLVKRPEGKRVQLTVQFSCHTANDYISRLLSKLFYSCKSYHVHCLPILWKSVYLSKRRLLLSMEEVSSGNIHIHSVNSVTLQRACFASKSAKPFALPCTSFNAFTKTSSFRVSSVMFAMTTSSLGIAA